jgi:hypothetical protein
LGAFAGAGVGLAGTTADNIEQFNSTTRTTTIEGGRVGWASASLSNGGPDGVQSISLTVGRGEGVGFTSISTTSVTVSEMDADDVEQQLSRFTQGAPPDEPSEER